MSGYIHTGLDPATSFYKVEGVDNYDSGYEAVIHFKTDKAKPATKENRKRLTLPVIKYLDHQGTRVVHMIQEMTVSDFEQLGITTWKGIEQSWMYVEKVLKVKALNKFRISVLSCKQLVNDESG